MAAPLACELLLRQYDPPANVAIVRPLAIRHAAPRDCIGQIIDTVLPLSSLPPSPDMPGDKYTTTKALTILARKQFDLKIVEFPVPDLEPLELLLENVAVAQNPVDWKQVAWDFWLPDMYVEDGRWLRSASGAHARSPWTNGCDVAGTVVKVGSGITKFKVGDRVSSLRCHPSRRAMTQGIGVVVPLETQRAARVLSDTFYCE